jgi:replication factor C subunit 3/5
MLKDVYFRKDIYDNHYKQSQLDNQTMESIKITASKSYSSSLLEIPWSEKYRPKTFESTILEPINRKIFENIITEKRFPNILFYGQPGVGKTTSAINLIHMYQQKHGKPCKENVIHLNASDERGIEMIRNQIYNFVRSRNMFRTGLKFVILDEVDYMTKNAQQALKCLLHASYDNVRFCLICNYICKIDHSLLNEFVCVRFNKLPEEEIRSFFFNLAEKEGVSITFDMIERVRLMFNSDIRSMVNFLQLHHHDYQTNTFQNYDQFWEELHMRLSTNCTVEQIHAYIYQLWNDSPYFDIHRFLKGYFLFTVQNHPEYVHPAFLNIGESVVHDVNRSPDMTQYFVLQLVQYYETFHKKLKQCE